MSSLLIRNMDENDIKRVVAIEEAVFSSPWSEKSFTDALQSKDTVYLVAVIEGKVVGYCGLWLSYDVADLCNLAVDITYRGQSVGKGILEAGINLVKERQTERILLEVRKSNGKAKSLYQKLGFVTIGVRKNYYSNPIEDAILMQKEL